MQNLRQPLNFSADLKYQPSEKQSLGAIVNLKTVQTPALLLDLDKFTRNCNWMKEKQNV